MKTAIYIEDGTVQLVISPESEFEKNALRSFEDRPMDAHIFSGSFYDSRGGWVKQSDFSNCASNRYVDRSLIIRLKTITDGKSTE